MFIQVRKRTYVNAKEIEVVGFNEENLKPIIITNSKTPLLVDLYTFDELIALLDSISTVVYAKDKQ